MYFTNFDNSNAIKYINDKDKNLVSINGILLAPVSNQEESNQYPLIVGSMVADYRYMAFIKLESEHDVLEYSNVAPELYIKMKPVNTEPHLYEDLIKQYFPLSFMEAVMAVLEGEYVQGNDFRWNYYLAKDEFTGNIHVMAKILVDGRNDYIDDGPFNIGINVLRQKYRALPSLSNHDLMIKGINNKEYTEHGDTITI